MKFEVTDNDAIRKIIDEYYFKSSTINFNKKDFIVYEFLRILDERTIDDNLFRKLFFDVKLPSMIYYEQNIHKFKINIDDERLIIWLCYLYPNPLVLNLILWYIQYLSKNNLINLPIDFNSVNEHLIINDKYRSNEIIEKEILPFIKYKNVNDKDVSMTKDFFITLNFNCGHTLLY